MTRHSFEPTVRPRPVRLPIASASLLLALSAIAHGQLRENAEPILVARAADAPSSSVVGDFNGDGYDDYASGHGGAVVEGFENAGLVSVLYRPENPIGVGLTEEQIIHEAVPGVPGSPAANHFFGSRLAVGDFDRDLYDDLAITVPGTSRATNVLVFYGSPSGLDLNRRQLLVGGDDSTINVAAGDFNGDQIDDLAVAAPRSRSADASDLRVYYGTSGPTSSGLDARSATLRLFRDVSEWAGDAAAVYRFGETLAVGDFEGDGFDDLVLGSPDGFFVTVTRGWAGILRGSAFGLGDALGLISGGELGVGFARALATGDIDGNGVDDLLIRSTPDRALFAYYSQPGEGLGGVPATLSREGGLNQVTTGDFNRDGLADIVISAGGALKVAYSGPASTVPQFVPLETRPTLSGLGGQLAVGNFDGGGLDLVATATPGPTAGSELILHAVALSNELRGDPPGVSLQDGRFEISVAWRDFQGNTGFGRPVRQSPDSAIFHFFDSRNWELLIKVLNGCPLNQHFWTFLAATTDVEFTVRVTDRTSGTVRIYSNPLGKSADAVTDTSSFATCS